MRFTFDIRSLGRLFVVLALMLAVVGPACFLMSPDAAMADGMPAGGCESSTGGAQASFDGCPHSDSPNPVSTSPGVSKLMPAMVAVAVQPVVPSAVEIVDRSVSDAGSASDATRIRPLRL